VPQLAPLVFAVVLKPAFAHSAGKIALQHGFQFRIWNISLSSSLCDDYQTYRQYRKQQDI
jgi:hypothetical protein